MHVYRLKSLRCFLAVLALLAASPAAFSQTRGVDAAAQADEHFLKGKALLKAGNVRGAYEEYKTAWSLKRTYDIAANLGNLELSLGLPRDAAEHLAFSVRNYAITGTTPERLEKTKQLFGQARAQVGALTLKVNVEGAEVQIDGHTIGRAPIEEEIFVDPGSRTIEAKLAGYESALTTITAGKGTSEIVTLTLRAPLPPPTSTAPVPSPTRGPNTVVLATGGALAGVALITGAVFAGLSNAKSGDASDKRGSLVKTSGPAACTGAGAPGIPCADLTNAANDRRTFANVAFWSFVGAGTVGAGTLIYAFLAPKGTPKTGGLTLTPTAGPQGASLEVSGTW